MKYYRRRMNPNIYDGRRRKNAQLSRPKQIRLSGTNANAGAEADAGTNANAGAGADADADTEADTKTHRRPRK